MAAPLDKTVTVAIAMMDWIFMTRFLSLFVVVCCRSFCWRRILLIAKAVPNRTIDRTQRPCALASERAPQSAGRSAGAAGAAVQRRRVRCRAGGREARFREGARAEP